MMKSPRDSDRAFRAKLAVAQKALGMTDEAYRDMLWEVGRVRSSKDLDFRGRCAVIEHLKSKGWNPTARASDVGASPRARPSEGQPRGAAPTKTDDAPPPLRARLSDVQFKTIHKRAGSLCMSDFGLRSFIRRVTGIENIHWLTSAQARNVIAGLENMERYNDIKKVIEQEAKRGVQRRHRDYNGWTRTQLQDRLNALSLLDSQEKYPQFYPPTKPAPQASAEPSA